MDHIAVKEYVLVYFHTLTNDYNQLDSNFLKKLYDVVDTKWVSVSKEHLLVFLCAVQMFVISSIWFPIYLWENFAGSKTKTNNKGKRKEDTFSFLLKTIY